MSNKKGCYTMEKLAIFEDTKVHYIVENGQPLFELYSTGMALGQVKKNSKGISYPAKDRIDKNVANAEIKPCVRNVHSKYITESQLYDLMLEMKTEKVKPFRKWVTSEVIPSIRKTGSYKMKSATHNFPTVTAPYEYFDKTYGGQFVMTTDDLSQFLNVTRANVSEMIRKKLKIGTDYYFLEKTQLAWFKAQNPQVNKIAKHLIVVTRKGFDKLCNIYGVEVEKSKSFEIKSTPNDILERICKDNNITAIPLNDELRQMMRNMFRTDKSELEYVVELNGEKCIMYDDNATDLEKQCLVATGIAQIMNGRLNGEKKETTPEDVFAQVFTALSLFKQYSDKTP